MNRLILSLLIVLIGPLGARAEITDADIAVIGTFLKKDFACASSEALRRPVTSAFLVCEGKETDQVTAADAKKTKELYAARLPLGTYREIWVMCDVNGYGMLVRRVFVGPQSSVYWADEFQSLARLQIRPELSQLGVDRLAELSDEFIRSKLSNVRRGSLPVDFEFTSTEREQFVATMDVLPRVARMRE